MRATLLALGLLSAAVITATAREARADDCDTAFEQAQTLRDARKLSAERDQLRLCARAVCPAFMVKQCNTWLAEVAPRIPSVVLVATDRSGTGLPNVKASVDGAPPRPLDGTSWDVDPGQHLFSFVGPDGTEVDKSVLVVQGQKDQRVAVLLEPKPAAAPEGSPDAAGRSPDSSATLDGRTRRVIAFAVGGSGAAGVLLGAIFGGLAISAWSSASSACPRHVGCSASSLSDASTATTFSTVSDVGFIAGGILAAGGVALYLTAPKDQATTVTATLSLAPGGAAVVGRF